MPKLEVGKEGLPPLFVDITASPVHRGTQYLSMIGAPRRRAGASPPSQPQGI